MILQRVFRRCMNVASVSVQGRQRFYEKASVGKVGDMYGIFLDKSRLKTPGQKEILLEDEGLASLVAHEWDKQARTIQPSLMPMMKMVTTSIDGFDEDALISELARYFVTDTIFYYDGDNPRLHEAQKKTMAPFVNHMAKLYGEVHVVETMRTAKHSKMALENIEKKLTTLPIENLVGVESLCRAFKSLSLSLLVMEDHVTVEDAFAASRLEEEWQMQEWGLVEGSHDIDRANATVQVLAAKIYLDIYRR